MIERSRPDVARGADELAVRELERAYDAAWGAGDVDGVLGCMTEDVVVVNPRGEVARGHSELGRQLEQLLVDEFAGTTHTTEVVRVSFVTADVAIVDGRATVEGVNGVADTLVHSFTDVMVRRGEDWRIAHVRAYGLAQQARDQP